MRVFVTGAKGFVGRALTARLREQGVQVCGVDTTAAPLDDVVEGDIGEPGKWQSKAKGCDLVVHTAAVVSNALDFNTTWRINVLGTKHAIDAAVLGGASRFVHISSIRAFSDLDFPDGVDEEYPVRTDGNPYVDTKIAGEQVALQAHSEERVQVSVIRPGDVYGPGSRPWTLLPIELIKKNRFLLPKMGNGIFSPVYIDDLVDGLLLAASRPEAIGQVFTMTGGQAVTCKEFFGYYCRMLGKGGPIVVPTPVAIAGSRIVSTISKISRTQTEVNPTSTLYLARRGTYSIAKARRLLGYGPRIQLAEGMALTRDWLSNQGFLDSPPRR